LILINNNLKMAETYNRARIEILNYVVAFCTTTIYDGKNFPSFNEGNGFASCGIRETPPIGSLVRMMAAPFTKWYLSWVMEVKKEESGYHKYLLRSIDDGCLSWWENIGLFYMPLEHSDKFPQWKYSDKQYEFWDRWKEASKQEDVYILAALRPTFNESSVTLELRKKHSDDIVGSKTFPDWKKLTIKEMRAFIRETESYPNG